MNGFFLSDLHLNIVRSLRGRCLQTETGLVAKNGERHEHCGTCLAQCGGENLGLSDGLTVGRVWGSDKIELRWACPGCSVEVTQETTALDSLANAKEAQRDPLCHKCRKSLPPKTQQPLPAKP